MEPFVLSAPALVALLAVATCDDLLEHRVPNALVLTGLVIGLTIATLDSGVAGLSWSLAGIVLGGALLMPFYLLGGMAAGDVKLMAMVGCFVGPSAVIVAVAVTLAMGGILGCGVLALFGALRSKWLAWATARLRRHRGSGSAGTERVPQRPSHIPYALAISVGALTAVWLPAS